MLPLQGLLKSGVAVHQLQHCNCASEHTVTVTLEAANINNKLDDQS